MSTQATGTWNELAWQGVCGEVPSFTGERKIPLTELEVKKGTVPFR